MTDETKERLFPLTFAGAALFYGWAIVSLWVGPHWGLTGGWYMIVGVLPALVGVLCTVAALLLHMDLQDSDSTNRDDFR